MIGSPSDVKEEIQLVIQSIYDWDNTFSEKEKVVLLPSHWTINTYPAIGDEPQALINDQMTKYCDLMVAIFNARLGTPTKKTSEWDGGRNCHSQKEWQTSYGVLQC